MRRTQVYLNKPIHVGITVLDVSKTLMYNFHYDYMKKKYGYNCKLLYTDTDSLIYKVKCQNIYEDMKANIYYFDTISFTKLN